MADSTGVDEGTIRSYLADRGGSVEDPSGRGLTDDMARAIGLDRPAALTAVLAQMEQDGTITREMRGLRTFRIALADRAEPAHAEAPRPAENGADVAGSPLRPGAGAVSLRQALSRQNAGAAAAGADDAPAGPAPGPPRSVSLREALNQTPADAPSRPAPAGGARWEPAGAARPATPLRPTRAYSTARDGGSTTAVRPEPTPPASSPAPAPPPATPSSPAYERPPSLGGPGSGGGREWYGADESEGAAPKRKGSSRFGRTLAVADATVESPPSSIIVAAVVVAAAGLVLLAVILVVVARSGKHVSVNEVVPLSTDACNVVNTDLATTLFGQPAGQAHFVLGECVYDDGANELIVEVFRQNARALFETGRSSTALDVPGLGDAAYYVDGRLRVLSGNSLLEIALGPTPAATPPPKLLTLAGTAVGRL